MVGLLGLAILFYGLWIGLGGTPFVLCVIGIVLIAVDEAKRRTGL